MVPLGQDSGSTISNSTILVYKILTQSVVLWLAMRGVQS